MSTESKIEWRWGVFAALAMTIIALYPQINLWIARGSQWQGSYVLTQGDEVAYSAYINALIDGRPRRNDPFNGRDDVPGKPAYESLFSIQCLPAYAVALPARMLGISASTAFIWLIGICAIASSLAIFWMLATLTGDSKLAAVGVLFTLCFGALAAAQGVLRLKISGQRIHDMFSFLRRYEPSVVFPLFFVFCVLVWRALTRESGRARLVYSVAAGVMFSVLVFSYFYIWTAAGAWFAGVVLFWILLRRNEFRRAALTSLIISIFAISSVLIFFIMLSHRNNAMDQTLLLLTLTHAPDFLYPPEILGMVVLAVIGFAWQRKLIDMASPLTLFAASFALMPFIVFNQQVITGRSLQPIHYKVFIANYAALISVVLVFWILWRARDAAQPIPSRVLILTAIVALGWGIVEVSDIASRDAAQARLRDEALPVARRLTAMAREDGSLASAFAGKTPFPVAYVSTLDISKTLPSDSPVAVLWALHTPTFGVSPDESKQRFYKYMYYSGLSRADVADAMAKERFIVLLPLFGVDRVIAGLSPNAKPIAVDEMRDELKHYSDFYDHFNREQATNPELSFIVVPNGEAQPDFANLDKWYARDAGEKVGIFTIFRVKLRAQS